MIVYDDEDKSDLSFINQIKRLDKRIKIIVNKKNIGAGLSRNKAIKYSKGKFIAFIDADDLWHPMKLKKQITFMTKNDVGISHTSYKILNEKNERISLRKAKNLIFKDLIKSCDIGLSTVIIKKNILKNNYFVNLKTKEDYVLWLKLTKKGYKFYALNETLTYWRFLPDSLSSSVFQKLVDGYKVYRIFLKLSVIESLINLMLLSFNYLKK